MPRREARRCDPAVCWIIGLCKTSRKRAGRKRVFRPKRPDPAPHARGYDPLPCPRRIPRPRRPDAPSERRGNHRVRPQRLACVYMYYANSRFTCFGDHCGDFGTVGYGDNASRAALRFVRISGGGGVRGRDPQSRRFWQRQSGPGARRTGRMESRAVRYLQLRRSGDDPLQEVRHGYPHVLLQKTGVTRPGRSSEPQPPSPAAGTEGPSPCTPVTWACSSGPGPGTSGLASGIGSRPAPATGG